MPSTLVNGVNLYYECHGEGEPLLLIAGLGSDSQSWLPIVKDLSREFLVITVDNRGTGRTTPQDVETSIQHIADDCMALIGQLGLSSATVLGHSMGGFVALDCATRYPRQVTRLILACTSSINSQRNNILFRDWISYRESGMELESWFRNLFYWIFSTTFFENGKILDEAVSDAVAYPYAQSNIAFEQQVRAIETFDCRNKLAGIEQPVLIICGKADLLFPPDQSIDALRSIPATRHVVVEGAAHSIHMEKPGAFTDCVSNFMAEG